MKNLKKQSLLIVGGLVMMMNAGAAISSTTHASALIDWSTFAITGYALGENSAPTYTLAGYDSSTTSSISDWVNWSSNVSNTGSSFGATTEGTGAGTGNANAQRDASLTISGTGFLLISADYLLSAAINGTGCNDYYCYDLNSASAGISFNLTNMSASGSHSSASQAGISLGSFWGYPNSDLTSDQKEGTLRVGVIVNDGDILNFSSAVYAFAHEVVSVPNDNGSGTTLVNSPYPDIEITAVPVPAAIWLFASALFGLAGLSRKRAAILA